MQALLLDCDEAARFVRAALVNDQVVWRILIWGLRPAVPLPALTGSTVAIGQPMGTAPSSRAHVDTGNGSQPGSRHCCGVNRSRLGKTSVTPGNWPNGAVVVFAGHCGTLLDHHQRGRVIAANHRLHTSNG